ncbi:tetratricopeptide repeat protein [Aquipluma nitroreducens]|uniref:tetratricopeptide repeat protein n=1 Tax=Aquipluma nitroreducens TaxID=2010828 RepID=UPI00296FCECE|nr:tetratricopeptide repeat protein [Aquipluma nitroreducens]
MRNRYLAYFAVISVLSISCATAQKRVKSAVASKPAVEENSISEDDKNEFEYTFIEGLKQKMIGNQQAAISLFSKCLTINPNSSSAMFELAKIHSGNGDMTSSSLLLEKAIKIEPENKWYKVLLAQIYEQGKQFKLAAELYQQLYQLNPDNLEYLYMNAALLSSAKEYDQAIEVYNTLEKKVGINDQIAVEKEQIYQAAGKKKEALAELQKLIDFNPQEPRYYGLMADYYLSEKEEVNALKYYMKILEIDPNNGFVLFSLTSFYREKEDKEKAWEYARKAFENKTAEVDTKIQFYLMITAGPDKPFFTDDQISELVDILVKTNPDDFRVYTVYAEYLISKGKLVEAREQLRKVLETQKDNYMIWERMILISNDLLDFKSIYTDSEKALTLFPNQVTLYGLKAVACLQLEKYDEALEILKEGEPYLLDNKIMKIQFALYQAEAYYKLNRVEEAFKAFDEVITLDPENWMAMNNYAYYLSVRNENLAKAEELSSKAVRANPENSTYLDTYAWVLFMRKDYSLAKFYMETAMKNGGDKSGVITEHYGDILIMLGEKEKAIEEWKKALELGEGTKFLGEKIKQERYLDK